MRLAPPHHRTPLSVWTAPESSISTPTIRRRGVRSVREVREPRRIISAVTGLTGSGRVGGPGVSAPRLALERMESLGRNLEVANALRPNMEEKTVKETERRPQTATLRAVQLTAIGLLTGPGAPVVRPAGEEPSSERGLVLNQKMEGETARESPETRDIATLRTAVRRKMESSNAVMANASVLTSNVTEPMTVEIMRMNSLMPVQES